MHAAATVLLLREGDGELEVRMMRRGSGLSFMAGMWVFPGGRVDASDASEAIRARISSDALGAWHARLHTPQGEPLAEDAALALHVAACRETFEESGVLLALLDDPQLRARGFWREDGVIVFPLDAKGNSVRGIRVCNDLSNDFGLHLFNTPRVITPALKAVRTGGMLSG